MLFGMPTLVELEKLEDCAKLASELGLGFIEINMSFPEYTRERFDVENAKNISKKYGVFYTIHADEALNPFDFNKTVSDCYFKVMMDTIAVAKDIGAKVINLHLQKGIYVTLPEKVVLLTDIYRDEYLNNVKRFIYECEKAIGDSGILIAIENVDSNEFSKSQIEAIDLFMQSDAFALTLDTGHDVKLNFIDSHIYEKYPNKLMHMHLHDCKAGKPHLPLGTGEVDIKNKLSSLVGETCLIEVKTVSGLIDSIKYIRKDLIDNG